MERGLGSSPCGDNSYIIIYLSNRSGRPFWPDLKKGQAGPTRSSIVASRAGPPCQPTVPAMRASPPTMPILLFHIKLSIILLSTTK